MSRLTQAEIEQMIQYARPTNRDLVRREINQAISSPSATLILSVKKFVYHTGAAKELLCLEGTVGCTYNGSRYNIPIEIWLQQDHPMVSPIVYVRPTSNMYVAPSSRDVQPDGTVIIPYLRSWRHPNSELVTLISAMSEAFSKSPPVYSAPANAQRSTPYPSSYPAMNASPYPQPMYPTNSTPYPTPYPNNSSMPMPNVNTSPPYPYQPQRQQQDMHQQAYRDSIVTAVFDRVRPRFDDAMQIANVELSSMKQIEQDLGEGQKKLDRMINDIRNQQVQAQNHMTNLKAKIIEATQAAAEAQNAKSNKQDDAIIDDALLLPAPVYKQLLQAYAEEHAIQDLLYYLAEGLRRESIGLDTYLKHVRELSRKQFMLRATMHRCRQIANLSIK